MKSFILALSVFATAAVAQAAPAPISANDLPQIKEGVAIAISTAACTTRQEGQFSYTGFGGYSGRNGYSFSQSQLARAAGSGTIDNASTDPLLTLSTVTGNQKLVLSITTDADMRVVKAYSIVEYTITNVEENTGNLIHPVIVHRVVDQPTGSTYTCQ